MKISIYELLGRIKDGNAPARILYDDYIWSWTGDDYKTILRDEKEQFLITGMYYEWFTDFIKAEVEIIEEPFTEEIKEIKTLNNVGNSSDLGEFKDKQQLNNHILKDKINEIIRKLKEMEK